MTTLPLTEHKRNVLKAWLDGKTIQTYYDGKWKDYVDDDSGIIAGMVQHVDGCYRIKPTPTRRFWDDGEIPLGHQVREINKAECWMIISVAPGGAMLANRLWINAMNYMNYVVATPGPANAVQWQPAGVEE